MFVELPEGLWLLDTGAPTTFGNPSQLSVDGQRFAVRSSYLGLNAERLTQQVGVPFAGLLGGDVLGRFDHLMDVEASRISMSQDELPHSGERVELDEFMGIPIVTANVAGRSYRMFLDTGAQVSYFQDDSLASFPAAGAFADSYPGFGPFQTETHTVPLSLNGIAFSLRCGTLPAVLGMTLMTANTQGILGNAVLRKRVTGFFPRRGLLFL